jgi:four helix bundle suffix protein
MDKVIQKNPSEPAAMIDAVLKSEKNWKDLWFYQKTVVLFQMTYVFTKRFLPKYGDRTVDQMVQAARSGKQNIVEGMADGVTSMELELKLLNVARASIKELREDYEDYLLTRQLSRWQRTHPRYHTLVSYCREHNALEDYEPYMNRWSDEEMANVALSLCHFVDKMMKSYEEWLEVDFKENGGIRERMTAARLGYRNIQKAQLDSKDREIARLKAEIVRLQAEIDRLKEKEREASDTSDTSGSSETSNTS